MAHANAALINALRRTAKKLAKGAAYQWGHMGSCNCGNLAQELTQLTKAEIHQFAMQGRGDWREQVEEYCSTSGLPMDLLIADLLNYGLTTTDLQHLERLSDPKVLARIPLEIRHSLLHNNRADVVLYMSEWARLLEDEFLPQVKIDLSFMKSEKISVLANMD
jgi:predicted Co/Zn/Cd cation transporter (cation efflux family)